MRVWKLYGAFTMTTKYSLEMTIISVGELYNLKVRKCRKVGGKKCNYSGFNDCHMPSCQDVSAEKNVWHWGLCLGLAITRSRRELITNQSSMKHPQI